MNIPARFREILKEKYESEFLIVTNWHNCLRVYPEDEWEEFEEDLLAREQPTEEEEQFIRYVVSGVAECQLDKQGRILLPANLRNSFNLSKEVILNGMLQFFEIWDKATWEVEEQMLKRDFPQIYRGVTSRTRASGKE